MKTEKFLRTRIVLYLLIYLIMCIIFTPLQLMLLGLEYLFGKIQYKIEPRLRYVTEKQFKNKIVKTYAAGFLGMNEKDLRKRWK